jgi:hypothetical protein
VVLAWARVTRPATLPRASVARSLERAVDAGDARRQHLRDLGGGVADDVAEQEGGALARGKQLYRGDEGELDALHLLRLSLRRELVEQTVGIRIQVHRLTSLLLGIATGSPGALERNLAPARAPLQHRQTDVGGDPVEPGAERRARLEAVEPPPGAQQRLLQRVVHIFERAEHPVAMDVELASERQRQSPERALVPRSRRGE